MNCLRWAIIWLYILKVFCYLFCNEAYYSSCLCLLLFIVHVCFTASFIIVYKASSFSPGPSRLSEQPHYVLQWRFHLQWLWGSTKLSVKIMCLEKRIKAFLFVHFPWFVKTANNCIALWWHHRRIVAKLKHLETEFNILWMNCRPCCNV